MCRSHPLYSVFAADPVTERARAKPRGYAGDAVMIDYIYQGIPRAERFTIGPLGAALFAATTSSSSAVAVRERRHLLAQPIGYTEGFMDWRLLCRSERDLRRLCASIPADEIASIATRTDQSGCIAYLTLVRA